MEESVYALGGHGEAFSILRECRKYIDQEIRAPNNQLPPLEDGLALSVIRNEARRYRHVVCVVCGAPSQCTDPYGMLRAVSDSGLGGADTKEGLSFVCIAMLHTDPDTGLPRFVIEAIFHRVPHRFEPSYLSAP